MVKVRARERGYAGGIVREQGDEFSWPAGVPVGSWVDKILFDGKGDHDGDGKPGGSAPAEPEASANEEGKPVKGKAGKPAKGKPETVQAAEAEPFADAPAPAAAEPASGNAEPASVEPDWIAPGSEAPVMAEE